MNKLKHALLLAALVMTSLVAVSSASAADVAVLNGSSVTGNATTSAFFTSSSTLACATAGSSATLANASGAYPIAIGGNLALTFSSCRIAGIAATVSCTTTGVVSVTGTSVLDDTPLSWSSLSCGVTVAGRLCATISGSVTGTYNNITQRVTLGLGRTLTTAATCVLSSGATSLTANSTGTAALVYQWPATLRMLAS